MFKTLNALFDQSELKRNSTHSYYLESHILSQINKNMHSFRVKIKLPLMN